MTLDHLRALTSDGRDTILRKLSDALAFADRTAREIQRIARMNEYLVSAATSAQASSTNFLRQRREVTWSAVELLEALAESQGKITMRVRVAEVMLRHATENK